MDLVLFFIRFDLTQFMQEVRGEGAWEKGGDESELTMINSLLIARMSKILRNAYKNSHNLEERKSMSHIPSIPLYKATIKIQSASIQGTNCNQGKN